MIVQTVDFTDFCDAFAKHDRKDQFTREALRSLFDYYTDYDENIELDPIAICCDWTEYTSATEAASQYFQFEGMTFGAEGNEIETADQVEAKALEFLNLRTTVLRLPLGGVVIQNF